jgi:selenocysteine lyase/cysteine desulfurase
MTILAVQPCPAADDADFAPLAEVVGADLSVPLVQGGSARYVNPDYAASAPALRAVADRVAELLPLYSSVQLAASSAALLAVTGASNVTGECPPLAELTAIAHRHGARIVVDGAQLVPHRRVSLAEPGIDYLAFSGHKIYAPFEPIVRRISRDGGGVALR